MVESDGASCITGAWASADTIPTAESVTIPEEVLLISPASTSDEITGLEDDGLVNRTAPPDSFQGPTLAEYLVESRPRWRRGHDGQHRRPQRRLRHRPGGHVQRRLGGSREARIGEEVVYDIDLPNYDTEADQITSGNPDGIVIVDFPETYNKVGPALVRTGNFDPSKAFVTDGLISSDLAEGAGEDAVNGLRGTAPGSPTTTRRRRRSTKLFTAFEPTDVDRQTFDAQNFDAVVLCYLAAVAAGSTEGRTWRRRSRRQRAARRASTPGSSSPRRSRRCRTATTSITRAPPARSTWTRTAMRPPASMTSTNSRAASPSPRMRSRWLRRGG